MSKPDARDAGPSGQHKANILSGAAARNWRYLQAEVPLLSWKKIGRLTTVVVGSTAVIVTLLPVLPSNEAWVRIWDFPRVQLAVVLAAALIAAISLFHRSGLLVAVAIAAALAFQISGILPFTPLYAIQAQPVQTCAPASQLRLMVANVLITNRDARRILAAVDTLDPDILLLVETDEWWDSQLANLRRSYPHSLAHPQDNGYGMHLFSRLPLTGSELRFRVTPGVPSIRAGIRLRSGAEVVFHGLHPVPPPLRDTGERDAELLLTASEVRSDPRPAVVAGDLNDVAWSRTTVLFQEVSGLLDPRIGRGLYSTFNANWPLLRWPIDHVFFSNTFRLVDLRVGGHIGSDHYPIFAVVCHQPAAAAVQPKPQPEAEDLKEAEETIEEATP